MEELIDEKKEKRRKIIKKVIIGIIIVLVVSLIGILIYKYLNKTETKNNTTNTQTKTYQNEYKLTSNSLENFDLSFLSLENKEQNLVYSPLSIKYALRMLSDASNGDSKSQIDALIGDYKTKKYENNANMSFVNAMFVNNSYKSNIKESYMNNLTKYNASVIYDDFNDTTNINKWIKNKSLNLLENAVDDVSDLDYALVNVLAIDMEWKNKLSEEYKFGYKHEDYYYYIRSIYDDGYDKVMFNNKKEVASVEFGSSINNYDIVKTLGEENIRNYVQKKYEEWLETNSFDDCLEFDIDKYIKELDANYNTNESSTDFMLNVTDEEKVFAKDLKEYNGITLQYVAIMPTNENLSDYIKNVNSSDIQDLIDNLKTTDNKSFKDGVITEIYGSVPMFNFSSEIDLKSDLKSLGITNVFDLDYADLSNLTDSPSYIKKTVHKGKIEFSNEGIKAASFTAVGGLGSDFCSFDYQYSVPVEKIDLTFNKPFMYLIRDKESGEIWFAGYVYEPEDYEPYNASHTVESYNSEE